MELRQLSHFVAVAEECHFTRAARRLHIAQSSLSASIQTLERELGAQLFVRDKRQVRLTDAGRALLVEARRALSTVTAAREAVAAVQGGLRGRVSVGLARAVDHGHLMSALGRFHRAHPDVEVALSHDGSARLLDQVRDGRLDLALLLMPANRLAGGAPGGDGLDVTPVRPERPVVACGPDHRFAQRNAVALGELRAETLVEFPGGGNEFGGKVAFHADDVHTMLDVVAAGLAIAVLPRTTARGRAGVRFVELQGEAPAWELMLAHPERSNAAAGALLAAVLASGDDAVPADRPVPPPARQHLLLPVGAVR
ncbi:LysR family transcriptional regulator [Kutzneria kofuensis]|uniref:DNA-binding transcriptional LysR family regulator n=1 Tax=Kutzneria kofuensis TaxID=103725 RepID=A0A7W9KDD3_9PSEU|nr:LysR family transcriptional regulator [Kutzneria kofuensis]MBB5890501.1 DNA-binding transcriptional LysR family regulator [Kutzneria kofuensis]